MSLQRATDKLQWFPTRECADGSLVHTFHHCRWGSTELVEWEGGRETREGRSRDSDLGLPLFPCRQGDAVHYSLLCDGKVDCLDRSDELGCLKPQFQPLINSSFICRNGQMVDRGSRCDSQEDCFDGSDEERCIQCNGYILCDGLGCVPSIYGFHFKSCGVFVSPPYITYNGSRDSTLEVFFDGSGLSEVLPVGNSCEEGSFQCRDGYCIPSFLLTNGEKDCPWGEDEAVAVSNVTCPGYYRCRGSGSCVHGDHVCDGVIHCPEKDDEMYCNLACPKGCQCEGFAYVCSAMFDPLENLHVRYLDLSSASNVTLDHVHFMEFLNFLNLSDCALTTVSLVNMPQLRSLDLSFNLLDAHGSLTLKALPGLRFLDLSGNRLIPTLGHAFTTALRIADLGRLEALILRAVGIEEIKANVFVPLSRLRRLDLGQNPLWIYGKDSLSGLYDLQELITDKSNLCCEHFHSSFTLSKCLAPEDELSSCDDLLGQDFFRVWLWLLAGLSVVGNLGVLVYRQFLSKEKLFSVSGLLVKNLCASDLLMGVYLLMIGAADARYHGHYVAEERSWRASITCSVAGFLSLLSSEVSAFMLCLITLDRVLVICYPFRRAIHLTRRSALLACCGLWMAGVVLGAVPLLAGIEFYGQSGICAPIPITRQSYSGKDFALWIFIILNFFLFILIGFGQVMIYLSVRETRTAAGVQSSEQDLAIARSLFLVVLTDFCCWFPICLMGLLAKVWDVPIPGIVNVVVAIFVLPINSALNPFLYTLNGLLEKRRAQREKKKRDYNLTKLKQEMRRWPDDSIRQVVKACLLTKALSGPEVLALARQADLDVGRNQASDGRAMKVGGTSSDISENMFYDQLTEDQDTGSTDDVPSNEIAKENKTYV